ncbi:unnamed protein product [Urochloa humidicola]
MEKAAGEDEITDEREKAAPSPPAARKRKRPAIIDGGASGSQICDDIAVSILARLPARAAVACTALSKRHRLLIRSPEFRSLHFRHAPPLPRPHIAYLATAPGHLSRRIPSPCSTVSMSPAPPGSAAAALRCARSPDGGTSGRNTSTRATASCSSLPRSSLP